MDPTCFLTPSQHRTNAPNAVPISKASVLRLISATPFDDIYVSNDLITDDEALTVQFVEAVGQALISILIQHLPQNSSPKKLLLSTPFVAASRLYSHLEADTPIKPRVKVEKPSSSMFVNEVLSDNMLGFMSRLTHGAARHDQAESSVQQKKDLAMQAFREESKSGISYLFAPPLTRRERVDTAPRELLQSQITWSHSPDFPRIDPVAEPSRLEALRKVNVDSDPFHIARLERREAELYPFVWIRGRVQVAMDENGNLPAGFQSEFQDVETLALLDTGNDTTVITQEFLGLNLSGRGRV